MLGKVGWHLTRSSAGSLPLSQVVLAGLRRDREPGRDGEAQVGHLGEVRALATEKVLQVLVALNEVVDVLLHCKLPHRGHTCGSLLMSNGQHEMPGPCEQGRQHPAGTVTSC